MKRIYILIIFYILLASCKKETQILYPENYNLEQFSKEDILKVYQDSIGQWFTKGVICYGIVILNFEKQLSPIKVGIPVKVKVISFSEEGIKCKLLENIKPYEALGCQKLEIKVGQTWLEKNMELFQNEDDAFDFLIKNNLNLLPF